MIKPKIILTKRNFKIRNLNFLWKKKLSLPLISMESTIYHGLGFEPTTRRLVICALTNIFNNLNTWRINFKKMKLKLTVVVRTSYHEFYFLLIDVACDRGSAIDFWSQPFEINTVFILIFNFKVCWFSRNVCNNYKICKKKNELVNEN